MSEPLVAGPWYVGAQNDILYIIDQPPRPSNDEVNPDQDVTVIAKLYGYEPAHANLLAAAPELLRACKEAQLALRATSREIKNYSHELGLLREAIAKAEGVRQ